MRGIKLLEGVLYPPGTENIWKDYLYITVYPKGNYAVANLIIIKQNN